MKSRVHLESRMREVLEYKFPSSDPRAVLHRDHVEGCCVGFANGDYSDANLAGELCSGIDSKFWSRLTEAFIAQRMKTELFKNPIPKGAGPDFLLGGYKKRVWVEAICSEPSGKPDLLKNMSSGEAYSMPHRQIALRWTAAISAKSERLLTDTPNSYLNSGLRGEDDIFVIAVNGCQLRNGPFPALEGISQFPVAAEVCFGFSAKQPVIDRQTPDVSGSNNEVRPFLINKNNSEVPAASGGSEPSSLIQNPYAKNPLPERFLPSDTEYVATDIGNSFELGAN